MCRARKDMLRARADKVYAVLRDYAPPPVKAEPERPFMHTSPVISSTQAPATDLMSGFDSPRSNSEPLPGPAPVPVSAFSFIAGSHAQEPDVAPEPSPTASPTGPSANASAFSFLNGGRHDLPPVPVAVAAPPADSPVLPPVKSAFAFISSTPSPDNSPPVQPAPVPSAPPMSSGFSFLNQDGAAPGPVPSAPAVVSTPHPASESRSAFGFLQAGAGVPAPIAPPAVRIQPRHDVFDSLPAPTPMFPRATLEPVSWL